MGLVETETIAAQPLRESGLVDKYALYTYVHIWYVHTSRHIIARVIPCVIQSACLYRITWTTFMAGKRVDECDHALYTRTFVCV